MCQRVLAIAACVALGLFWAMPVSAQNAKKNGLPSPKEMPKEMAAKFQPDQAPTDRFPHGMEIVVLNQNRKLIRGTVVYANESKGFILLRTEPGVAPRKFTTADIREIYFAPKTPAKNGGIKPAANQGNRGGVRPGIIGPGGIQIETPPQSKTSEIHQVEIINGSHRTVQYVGENISASERDVLARLQQAENDYARLRHKTVIVNEYVIEQERLERERSQALADYYLHASMYALGFRPISELYPYYVGYPGAVPFGVDPLYEYGAPTLAYGSVYAGYATPYLQAAYGYGDMMHNPVLGEVPSPIKTVVAETLVKETTPEALNAAHERLLQARANLGLYDRDGRLVAVNTEAVNGGVRPVKGEKK